MTSELRFTPGQQAVINGTVNVAEVTKGMTQSEKTKWRIEQVKLIVRSKPAGFLFTNAYFRERLGFPNDGGFFGFKNTDNFKRTFNLTPKVGTYKFELAVVNDAKTVAMIEPTYKKPEVEEVEEDKTVPELPPQAVSPSETLLELAKRVAIERLAREMTVGEVLDGAKQFNL